MISNNDAQQSGARESGQRPNAIYAPVPLHTPASTPYPAPRRHLLRTMLISALLIMLVASAVAAGALAYSAGNQVSVRIGNQQSALIDLRQSFPISPYLLGANVFPETGTLATDQVSSGFMSYGSHVTNGLRSAHVKLLRFPGGDWGELHAYSFDQLNAFSNLLGQVNADGMIQVPLSDPSGQAGSTGSLASRASNAGLTVDYMNNKQSIQRTGKYAHAPFHPVALWTVGNEPDRLLNPDTGLKYTVDDYVTAFVQFSTTMHQNDPSIKVFGPEISQFYGLGSGPVDATGTLWMEGFLKGVSDYERQHPTLRFHLLDGVSFHRYQFDDAHQAQALLLSSTSEWDYLLPPLHQLIRQDFGRDLPVALTEVNTNPGKAVPTPAFAAVWWADTLGKLMSQQVAYVAFFSTEGVDTPYPLLTSQGLQETPMLRVMQLFAHLQSNFVPVQVQSEPVSVYATQDDTRQTVSLLFVNKSDSVQQAQISTEGTPFPPVSSWPALQVNLNAYSVVVVTLHRGAGADAYSLTPTPTAGTTTPALTHTVCGNQGNVLLHSLPC
jgi:hypothetical protein